MARSEGRVLTSIWTDPDFVALDEGPQRLYLFLLSQPDLNHLGVIHLAPVRWAGRARDATVKTIRGSLAVLAHHRFVLVDEAEELVMIRTFLRNDKVCRQPNVLRAALAAIPTVTSARLRGALLDELTRIEAEDSTERTAPILAEMKALLKTPGEGFPEGFAEGFTEPLSEGSPNPLGDRGEGLGVSSEVAVPARRRAPARGTRIPRPFPVTSEMVAWARERVPLVDGRRETEKFENYWVAKSGAGGTKLDWPATWRNWMLGAAERVGSPNGTGQGQPQVSTATLRAEQASAAGRRAQELFDQRGDA